MAQLKIFLFGSPRLECDGRRVEIGLRKSIAILAYLAYTRQTQSREMLAAMFWPGENERTALGNLRRALYRINHAAPHEILLLSRKTVELNSQLELWLDAAEFLQAAAPCLAEGSASDELSEECTARLIEAVELYTDGFLAGFTLQDSPAFDEWQFFQGESLRQLKARAVEKLAASFRFAGQWSRAIDYARRWVALDPFSEPAHRALIELYAASGQFAAAMRQYETCCRMLAEELGVQPDPETVMLFEAIRRRQNGGGQLLETRPADASLESSAAYLPPASHSKTRPGPPHNLPVYPNAFVGRKSELAALRRLLAEDPACRLLTVLGPGGAGKTRLALEAAHGVIRAFTDGIFFVQLASLAPVGNLLAAVADQIGLPPYKGASARQQLLHYLSGKRMLLILDNFDYLVQESEAVAEILRAAPGVKILVTSRERLNLSGEMVFTLGGMRFPDQDSAAGLQDFGGVQLLQQCARLARPQVKFTAADMQEMARISRLVQGMPLALVLAAGWFEVLSLKEIADEIESSLDFLAGTLRDAPDRHCSVRAAFDYSWRRLAPADQGAFMRLSVFEGGFTRQAARRVAGAEVSALRTLIDKSLIYLRRDGRYDIHELLRHYGVEQLAASGEAQCIRDLHRDYYLGVLAQRERELKGLRQAEALEAIETSLENIRAAWKWTVVRRDEQAICRSVEALYLFYSFRSWYQEGAELLQSACLELAPPSGRPPSLAYCQVLARLALFQILGTVEQEGLEPALNLCLQTARQQDNQQEMAFVLMQTGCFHQLVRRDPSSALSFFEQSFALYQSLGDRFYMAVVLHWMGGCHGVVTGMAAMLEATRRSLDIARASGNEVLVAYNLRSLAVGELCSGNYASAERCCREALALDARMRVRMGESESKTLLSLVHFLQGDLASARDLAGQSLQTSQETGFQVSVAHALAALSLPLAVSGDWERSEALAQESLASSATRLGIMLAQWGLAITFTAQEKDELAWRSLRQALHMASAISSDAPACWLLPAAAVLLARSGQAALAITVLSASEDCLPGESWVGQWELFAVSLERLRSELCPARYRAAWESGKAAQIGWIVEYLLSEDCPASIPLLTQQESLLKA